MPHGRPRSRSGSQGPRDGAQGRADRWRPARQAGGLFGTRSEFDRALRRRGRLRRRLGQAGPRPALPGHPPDQGQDHQCREGAPRQGAAEYRGPDAHHRDRHGHRRGRPGRRIQHGEAALRPHHHHDRRRRGRVAHSHAAAHVFLPPDARAREAGENLYRAAAALFDQAQEARGIRRRRRAVEQDPHLARRGRGEAQESSRRQGLHRRPAQGNARTARAPCEIFRRDPSPRRRLRDVSQRASARHRRAADLHAQSPRRQHRVGDVFPARPRCGSSTSKIAI